MFKINENIQIWALKIYLLVIFILLTFFVSIFGAFALSGGIGGTPTVLSDVVFYGVVIIGLVNLVCIFINKYFAKIFNFASLLLVSALWLLGVVYSFISVLGSGVPGGDLASTIYIFLIEAIIFLTAAWSAYTLLSRVKR